MLTGLERLVGLERLTGVIKKVNKGGVYTNKQIVAITRTPRTRASTQAPRPS